MDKQAEQQQIENEIKYLEDWKTHPITKELLEDNIAEQDALVNLICEKQIYNLETFFSHFEAVGHLRGLRRLTRAVDVKLEELKSTLAEV